MPYADGRGNKARFVQFPYEPNGTQMEWITKLCGIREGVL